MGFGTKPALSEPSGAYEMAIYSLHHQPIGKSTQARPHTSAAHVRYITRPSAASRVEAGRMPAAPQKAAAFMVNAEDKDRKNGRVADKVLLALPRELDASQRADLVRSYAEEVTQGRASWLAAFHDQGKDAHNPHAHLLIRDRDPDTGKRVAGLSEQGSTEKLRTLWEDHTNRALEKAGRSERVDRRTLAAQGIEREPTVHEGPKAQQMERRGAQPESRERRYRNRPGSTLPHRKVDYRKIDKGRSRPAYNRHVRETAADYWQALDSANQADELEALRAIHHPPASVTPLLADGRAARNSVIQNAVNPSVTFSNFASLRGTEGFPTSLLASVPPAREGKEPAPERVSWTASHNKVFKPAQRAAKKPAKPVEQNINHETIIGNKIPERKGDVMDIDDEDRRIRAADVVDARAREAKSRAARDIALDKGYMRPDLAGPSIDKFYKTKGEDKLKERFSEFAGPSLFGVKRGNPLTKEGRLQRAEANHARKDIPDLWAKHDREAKNLAAAERSYQEKYGSPAGASEGPKGGPSGQGQAPGGGGTGGAGGGLNPQKAPHAAKPQENAPPAPEPRRSEQTPDDRKNNEAMKEARERLAAEQHPAHTQNTAPASQGQDEKLEARRRMMDQMRDRQAKEKELEKEKGRGGQGR